MAAEDFSRLELLCRRVATLPVLPTTALQLIRTIDGGDASAAELEKIIVNDPSLSAEFLRLATNSQLGKQSAQVTSIRAGIMRMGQRTVRALATSLLVRDLVQRDSGSLDRKHFAKHSLAVGLLAKFLYARKKMAGGLETRWSADEVFAAGLLSDLGYVLIAKMLPDTFLRLKAFAKKNGKSLDETFMAAFENPASKLGAAAADTWNLPEIFKITLNHMYAPWEYFDEFPALCCLNYAGALATEFDLGMEDWRVEVEVSNQILFEVGVPDEEKENLKEVLFSQLESYSEVFGGPEAKAA